MVGDHTDGVRKDAPRYRIVVRSELGDRFAPAFEGMSLRAENGKTYLTGEIIDQPHLHGIIDRISDFGLELLSVECLSERGEEEEG